MTSKGRKIFRSSNRVFGACSEQFLEAMTYFRDIFKGFWGWPNSAPKFCEKTLLLLLLKNSKYF